jgi:hypothetical protein
MRTTLNLFIPNLSNAMNDAAQRLLQTAAIAHAAQAAEETGIATVWAKPAWQPKPLPCSPTRQARARRFIKTEKTA